MTVRDHRSPNSQESLERRAETRTGGMQLVNFVAYELPGLWSTVLAGSGKAGSDFAKLERSTTGLSLQTQAALNTPIYELPELWSTPTVAATKGSQLTRGNERSDELLLNGQAIFLSSLLAHEIGPGWTLSATRLGLNPPFTDWLMGLPIGWTALGPLETPLCLWLPRARGLVLTLCSETARPTQHDLFA